MSVELNYITEGLLCKFYGFTLTDVRAMDNIERDVYIRYMNMINRIMDSQKKPVGYGEL